MTEDRFEFQIDTRRLSAWLAFPPFIAAAGVPVIQGLSWLKTGNWPPMPMSRFWTLAVETEWIGLNQVLEVALQGHVSLWLMALGSAFLAVFAALD